MFPYLQGGPRMMQSYPGMPQSQQGARPAPQTPGINTGSEAASGQQNASYISNARSPGGTGSFPFGTSAGSGNTPGGASLASQLAGLGGGQAGGQNQGQGQGGQLDLNDFPALGSGQQGGQGQNQGGAPGLGGLGGLGSGANSLSSYASQAGTGGLAAALRGSAPPGSFSQDDFPSLSQAGARGGDDVFLHGAAEQASAAAALQHQHQQREQHRQSLLGSVVGGGGDQSGQTASLSAARGGFGEPERNYATKLGSGPQGGPGAGIQQQTWVPPSAAFGGPGNGSSTTGSNHTNGMQGGSSPTSGRSPLPGSRLPAGTSANLAGSSPLPDNASARADGSAAANGELGSGSSAAQATGGGGNPPGLVGALGGMPQTPAQQVLISPADRFGLVGLLSIIKMQDPDFSMLTMGSDLQTLGLNLNASDSLYSSFITPWSDNNMLASMQVEPDFSLPSCYNVQPPPPAQSKIASFSDETLFFIFYSTPRDVLQEVAAQELYSRNWRYHKELHLWLTKEQNTEPTHKTPTYERGTYVFFDPGSWEKVSKNFVLMYELLEEKPPSQAHMAAQAHAQAQAAQAQAQAQSQQPQQYQQQQQQQSTQSSQQS